MHLRFPHLLFVVQVYKELLCLERTAVILRIRPLCRGLPKGCQTVEWFTPALCRGLEVWYEIQCTRRMRQLLDAAFFCLDIERARAIHSDRPVRHQVAQYLLCFEKTGGRLSKGR